MAKRVSNKSKVNCSKGVGPKNKTRSAAFSELSKGDTKILKNAEASLGLIKLEVVLHKEYLITAGKVFEVISVPKRTKRVLKLFSEKE